MKRSLILSIATLAIVAATPATAQTSKPPPPTGSTTNASAVTTEPTIIILTQQKPNYPFTTCLVDSVTLPSKPVEYIKNGKLFRLDNTACQASVDANLTTFTKKIDDAVISQQKGTYPLTTSALSGKPLGPTAVNKVWGTRLVILAEPAEVTTFDADPTSSIKKLNEAYITAQYPTYPYKKDPVNKEDIAVFVASGKTPIKYLWGNKLIVFTASTSVTEFEKTPETYLAVLETLK
jgi:hypothetical protein